MYSQTIQKLIEQFSKFPGVGPRSAARFVFYLLRLPKNKIQPLVEGIDNLHKNIGFCSLCYNPFELKNPDKNQGICPVCSDPQRNKSLLCVVEKESDLEVIEKTDYNGLYFVLGAEKDLQEKRFQKLAQRLRKENIKEIILALSLTRSCQRTVLWLKRKFKNLGLPKDTRISRLGCGLPQGGELEYADEQTLSSALKNRTP